MNSENSDFRERFAGAAADYRKRELQLWFVTVPLLLVFWYLVFFLPGAKLWILVPFLLLFGALLLGKYGRPKLVCPACEHDTGCEVMKFCPECGSGQVRTKGDDKYFLAWPQCQACGKKLSRRRGGERRYRIRFCTRCGAYLDEHGV